MIKTVIFDLDDTLYDFRAANKIGLDAAAAYAEKELGIPAPEFIDTFNEMMRQQFVLHSDVAGCHSRAIRAQMLCEHYHVSLRHAPVLNDIFWNTFIDSIRPFDGIPELFALIKGKGMRIGICTNMTADWQIKKLDKLGLADYCDFAVTSEEAGAEKPLPAIFALCAEKAGCKPDECLFIGDNPRCDAEGAAAAGMNGLWFAWRPETDTSKYPQLKTIKAACEIAEYI